VDGISTTRTALLIYLNWQDVWLGAKLEQALLKNWAADRAEQAIVPDCRKIGPGKEAVNQTDYRTLR